MQAIGIDLVEIERFSHWHTYSQRKLTRVFSAEEINYCLSVPIKSAERFAARFAAKEAFYKALSSVYGDQIPPFLTVAKRASIVVLQTGAPQILVDWNELKLKPLTVLISLSHTQKTACASVYLEQ